MPTRPLDTPFRSPSTNFAGQLEEAFNNIGASMMSYEFAGKLLAFLLKIVVSSRSGETEDDFIVDFACIVTGKQIGRAHV